MAAAGFSSQPNKQYFRKRKWYPGWMPTDAAGRGRAVGQLLCPPWHKPSAHRRRCWSPGREDFTCNWETWKVWKNALLKVTCCLEELVILNPALHWCASPAAESAGEPIPASLVGKAEPPWLLGEILGPSELQRCGKITMHYKWWTVFDRWPRLRTKCCFGLIWAVRL